MSIVSTIIIICHFALISAVDHWKSDIDNNMPATITPSAVHVLALNRSCSTKYPMMLFHTSPVILKIVTKSTAETNSDKFAITARRQYAIPPQTTTYIICGDGMIKLRFLRQPLVTHARTNMSTIPMIVLNSERVIGYGFEFRITFTTNINALEATKWATFKNAKFAIFAHFVEVFGNLI